MVVDKHKHAAVPAHRYCSRGTEGMKCVTRDLGGSREEGSACCVKREGEKGNRGKKQAAKGMGNRYSGYVGRYQQGVYCFCTSYPSPWSCLLHRRRSVANNMLDLNLMTTNYTQVEK